MFERVGWKRCSARRQRRLRATIAFGTVALCWYFAAALDAQSLQRTESPNFKRLTAFDAAFVAANLTAPVDRLTIERDAQPEIRIAQASRSKAPLL